MTDTAECTFTSSTTDNCVHYPYDICTCELCTLRRRVEELERQLAYRRHPAHPYWHVDDNDKWHVTRITC